MRDALLHGADMVEFDVQVSPQDESFFHIIFIFCQLYFPITVLPEKKGFCILSSQLDTHNLGWKPGEICAKHFNEVP